MHFSLACGEDSCILQLRTRFSLATRAMFDKEDESKN